MNREAELESQVRQLEQRNAATAEELRCSRDREKALREQVERLGDELEQERVRLAGCGVAALSPSQCAGMKPGDYGHSASMDDVLRVNEKLAASEARVSALEGALRRLDETLPSNDPDYLGEYFDIIREALAAAVPPKSPDVELYEAQERFVDARRAAAVPQPPPKQLVDEQFNDKFFDEMVRQGSPDPRRRISNVTKVYPMGQDEGPAVPQGEPHPAGWACNSCNPERGIRCALHKVEPTTSDDSHFHTERPWPGYIVRWSDIHGDFWVDLDGMPSCFATHEEAVRACDKHRALVREAPPAGEPTPDPWELLRRCVKYAREDRMVTPRFTRLQRVLDEAERALAAQPAPASPPRDESVPPPGWVLAISTPPDRKECYRGSDGWLSVGDAWKLYDAEHGYAPTVSREVDEAAADRYRLAIDLPEDVYPPERWVREVNKTCADLGLAECRIVAVGVDEAAVRASELAVALRDCISLLLTTEHCAGPTVASAKEVMMRHRRVTKRPAASGKDGAT